jgi:zinc transport system ATP-binding protein
MAESRSDLGAHSVSERSERLVEVHEVSFAYDSERVLEGVNLTIERGDILGLIGPNGGGKTTLLKIILGLLPVREGRVALFGTDVQGFTQWYRIGYVPQRIWGFDQNFPATLEEVAATGRFPRLGLFHRLRTEDHQAVQEALEAVGLAEHRRKRIGSLSAGQQQRAFLARALAGEAELLLLDEPTAAVDPKAQEDFYTLLERLNRKQGLTVVLVSHDLATVASQVKSLACLNRRMLFHGPVTECLSGDALAQTFGEGRAVLHSHLWH